VTTNNIIDMAANKMDLKLNMHLSLPSGLKAGIM
jgi:hypothetical protein